MVVMLIMSIILAAMAPVMTTRSKADSSSPWRYSPENLSDAFFGSGESQVAMIGQPNKLETDDPARLIINSSASLPVHLSFKRGDTILGRLQFSDTNVLLGSGNFDHLNGGSNNISIGPNNLTQLTSGSSNIAIGDNALTSNSSGSNNVGIGTTLSSNIEGSNNVAVGDNALASANERWNVAVGSNAYQNGTGGSNTIIGGDSMSQGSGNNNVAVGTNALWYGTGDGNVAIGANSNYKNKTLTTFSNSTAVGFSSFASGTNSVAIGSSASSSGESSIAIGNLSNSSDSNNVSIGKGAIASGYWSTAIGFESSASGDYSSAYGEQSTSSGGSSIALGNGATSAGISSVALGNEANAVNTDSIAIGHFAESESESGIAIGGNTYVMRSGGIAIGDHAKSGATNSNLYGDYGIAIGQNAGAGSDYSVSIGFNAGNTNKGTDNIAIGRDACKYVTGSNKICIGAYSGPQSNQSWATDDVERIFIGGKSNFNGGNAVLEVHNHASQKNIGAGRSYPATAVVINGSLIVKGGIVGTLPITGSNAHKPTGGANVTFLGSDDGNNNIGKVNSDGQFDFFRYFDEDGKYGSFRGQWNGSSSVGTQYYSDVRLKYVGKENKSGLDKIRQLKVFNYTFKKDEKKTPHVGVIAQDLQKIFPDAVKKGTDGFLSIRFEDMFFAMINAIKELDLKYQAQEKRIDELEKRIEKLESKIK